jgi:chloride channel protein, CIC family
MEINGRAAASDGNDDQDHSGREEDTGEPTIARGDDGPFVGPDLRPPETTERGLGDFTTTPAVLRLVPLALVVGAIGAGISLALLDAIGFVTNLLYYQRVSVRLVSPGAGAAKLGLLALVIPIGGGLIVGLMARFGSEQIRGHGIPEAMERILINGSRVQPRLALLKPLSSAISIGTGGPFGAEGPIILTGGAIGSIAGQLFRLTAAQRRALLVAGAAAGMSAVFGTPVAAALFGVELLAFEFRPRSMVLIGLASATADGLRMAMAHAGLVSPQPLFPVPPHPPLAGAALAGAAVIGIAGGLAAWVLTQAVYRTEDLFRLLSGHLHWMWWPLIGGVIIGAGGLIDPRALGVGYDSIHAELLGQIGVSALLLLFVIKLVIWSGGLGGGTSGGILAPVMMMGAALGGLLGHVLPGASPGTWALIGLAAALGGVTRSPFTAIVFAFELTHDTNSLLALLVAATTAHLVSVLILKRSILTEKVARRGFHVMREYAVDPLEATFVREVMDADVYTVEPDRRLAELYRALPEGSAQRRQRLYPVLDQRGRLVAVLPWSRVLAARAGRQRVSEAAMAGYAVAYPDEILRSVAERMATLGVGALPVVDRADPGRLDGLITQFDLMRARQKLLEEERRAEKVLRLRPVTARRSGGRDGQDGGDGRDSRDGEDGRESGDGGDGEDGRDAAGHPSSRAGQMGAGALDARAAARAPGRATYRAGPGSGPGSAPRKPGRPGRPWHIVERSMPGPGRRHRGRDRAPTDPRRLRAPAGLPHQPAQVPALERGAGSGRRPDPRATSASGRGQGTPRPAATDRGRARRLPAAAPPQRGRAGRPGRCRRPGSPGRRSQRRASGPGPADPPRRAAAGRAHPGAPGRAAPPRRGPQPAHRRPERPLRPPLKDH